MNKRIVLACIVAAMAGTAAAAPVQIKVGDTWTFEARNGYNKNLLTTYREEVTGVSDTGITARVVDDKTGSVASESYTPNWNPIAAQQPPTRAYEFSPAYAEFPDRLEPGVKWQGETMSRDPATGRQMKMKLWGTVGGVERVRVPAGEFNAIKISRETVLDDADFWRHRTHVIDNEWFVPELGHSVKRETHSSFYENTGMHPVEHSGDWTISELTAYKVN